MSTRSGFAAALVALVAGAVAAGCEPPPTRYVDEVFDEVEATNGVVYATAPHLVTGDPVVLRLDHYEPAGDTVARRPAVVWIHGGGFRGGNRTATTEVATAYTRRGYVTISVDYRLDPGNRCQAVQDGQITDPEELERERARCLRAILAAQHDTQAAVRWVRANAGALGVDRTKVAAGGFSAGALTAVHVAQRPEDPGTVGDNDSFGSRVGAGLAASGCNVLPESIGAGDAPIFLLASELDRAVDFDCVQETEERTEAAGLVVDTRYYFGEATHAKALYEKYRADVDADWTAFLVEHLDLG